MCVLSASFSKGNIFKYNNTKCVKCLHTFVPFLSSSFMCFTGLYFSRALHALIFYMSYVPSFFYVPDVPQVPAYLRVFASYVLSFFMCFTGLYFLRALHALILLRELRAFTFVSVSNFWRALCGLFFI